MLKEAIEKIASMAENKEHQIDGRIYTDKPVNFVPPFKERPKQLTVNTLSSLAELIHTEINKVPVTPIFVDVTNYNEVQVFTTYKDDYERDSLYVSVADVATPSIGFWMSQENAIIQLKSLYVGNEDQQYLLDLLSKITNESTVTSNDNGVTQNIEAKTGVVLKQSVQIKPIVKLIPYRTFLEVEQPESDFILRINDDCEILIKEADGGAWKLEAKQTIKNRLETLLKKLIDAGKVVVLA